MTNSLDALNWKQILKSYLYLHYCTEQFNNHSKKTNIPTKKKNEPLFSWGWGYHAYMTTIIRRKQIHNKEAWAIVLMMIPYNIYDIDCLKSWLKITFLVILSNVCNKHVLPFAVYCTHTNTNIWFRYKTSHVCKSLVLVCAQ